MKLKYSIFQLFCRELFIKGFHILHPPNIELTNNGFNFNQSTELKKHFNQNHKPFITTNEYYKNLC